VEEATRILAEHTRLASEGLRHRDELGDGLPTLREQEAIRGAVLQRLTLERASLDEEEKRVDGRLNELKQRKAQVNQDRAREENLLADTDGVIQKLNAEIRL
jgi:chromosome segregation protein